MVALAKLAKRVRLDNGNEPTQAALPRADRDAMEEFLEPARILLGALGFSMLEPLRRPTAPEPEEAETGDDVQSTSLGDIKLFLHLKKRGVQAEGCLTDEGFIVLAGSRGPLATKKHLTTGLLRKRSSCIEDGRLAVEGEHVVATEDLLFRSPSGAAAILSGGKHNGRKRWRDKRGVTLAQLEADLLEPDPSHQQQLLLLD